MTVYSSIITDGSGTVVRNISYQPWGNVHSNTEESGVSTLDPSHKFTGQILDDSTELYYYGARYYDPTIRRFITPDTIVQSPYDPQSLNRYAYVRNNPLIYTDPSGNWRLDNFLKSTLQVASYAAMFVPGLQPYAIPIAMASSAAQSALNGGHFADAMQAGIIGGISAGIGQGVAQGIGAIPGLGEGFAGALAQGAGAGFASGGAGAIMRGQSGANAWKAAYQGAAMGAATSVGVWGIQQGMNAYQAQRIAKSEQAMRIAEALNMQAGVGKIYAKPENKLSLYGGAAIDTVTSMGIDITAEDFLLIIDPSRARNNIGKGIEIYGPSVQEWARDAAIKSIEALSYQYENTFFIDPNAPEFKGLKK